MNDEQWRSIAVAFAADGGDASACGWCETAVDVLGVSGAGVTLMDGDQVGPLCVSGHGAAELEDLQFTLREGPCHDAFRSGVAVHVPRLDVGAPIRWLMFAELAVRIGVGAVFAFPIGLLGSKVGVLTIYQRDAGGLTREQDEACAGFAELLAHTIMATHEEAPLGQLAVGVEVALANRAEVHQAAGMVAARLDVPIEEALVRIRALAFESDRPVSTVAADIIARRLRLDDDREHFEGVEP